MVVMGDVEVARSSDLGVNDTRFFVRSHLCEYLKPGDLVMGYDLANSNLSVDLEDLPDVVLVRKQRPPREGKSKIKSGSSTSSTTSTARPTLSPGVNIADNDDDVEDVVLEMINDGLLPATGATLAGVMNAEMAKLKASEDEDD